MPCTWPFRERERWHGENGNVSQTSWRKKMYRKMFDTLVRLFEMYLMIYIVFTTLSPPG